MATEYVLVEKRKYDKLHKDEHLSKSGSEEQQDSVEKPTAHSSIDSSHTADAAPSHGDVAHAAAAAEVLQHGHYARRTQPLPRKMVQEEEEEEEDPYDQVMSDGDNDYDVTDVLQNFTSGELKYVLPIVKLMESHPDTLSWSLTTGEIIFKKKAVPNSNVVELLKDTLTGNLHPVGKMEFYRGLDIMEVRIADIKHPKNKGLLAVVKGDNRSRTLKSPPRNKVKRLKAVQSAKSTTVTPNTTNTTWLSWKSH